MADVATRWAEADFPVPHAHAVVDLWAALEALIDDIVEGALTENPELIKTGSLSRLKAPVADFIGLDALARSAWLRRELSRNTNADLKVGVGRFETLLAEVGLGGQVPRLETNCLFEMSQYRNLIVHRAGVADDVFVTRCPVAGLKAGEALLVSHRMYHWFFEGTELYAARVLLRLRAARGLSAPAQQPLSARPSVRSHARRQASDATKIAD